MRPAVAADRPLVGRRARAAGVGRRARAAGVGRRARAAGQAALPWLPLLFAAALAVGLGLLLWSVYRPAGATAWPGASGGAAGAAAAEGPIVPTRLAVPAIKVNAPVEERGTVRSTNPFTGQVVDGFGVPASMSTTAWWSDGPKPGSGQMAVILGHEQVGGGYGVFNDLGRLRPGDEVDLFDAGGAVLRLHVLAAPLTGLDKSTSALSDALNGHPAGADVALVTCGGQFDQRAGQSVDNTVVFARVIGR